MSIGIRIVGKGHPVTILETDEPCHRIWARAVHANLPVPINGPEPECGIDRFVEYFQFEPIPLPDRLPVRETGSAQRVDTQLEAGPQITISEDGGFIRSTGPFGEIA